MFGAMQLIGLFVLLAALYAWPVLSLVAFFLAMLDGGGGVIYYLLFASLIAHAPLAQSARRKIVGEGEFAGQIDKLKMAAPVFANMAIYICLYIFIIVR